MILLYLFTFFVDYVIIKIIIFDVANYYFTVYRHCVSADELEVGERMPVES